MDGLCWELIMQSQTSLLCEQLRPLLREMEYVLLDVQSVHVHDGLKVYITIYSEQGIGVNNCALLSKTLLPRLEVMLSSQDIALEVSSPGIERKLATFEEFMVFRGKHAKVLLEDDGWVSGLITKADEERVFFDVAGSMREFSKEQVVKAQLIYQGGS